MRNDCRVENMEALWVLFRDGNQSAFEKIIRIHYQLLFNYGTRFCKDEALVKDCIQDLFVSLWENRKGINNTFSVKNYLLKSIRRKVLRTVERSRPLANINEIGFQAGFNIVLPVEHNVIIQERLTELSFKVRAVLEKLSPRQQEIIYLRFYLEASQEEIADIMELTLQSVYNLLHESLKRFKCLSSPDFFSTL